MPSIRYMPPSLFYRTTSQHTTTSPHTTRKGEQGHLPALPDGCSCRHDLLLFCKQDAAPPPVPEVARTILVGRATGTMPGTMGYAPHTYTLHCHVYHCYSPNNSPAHTRSPPTTLDILTPVDVRRIHGERRSTMLCHSKREP